MKISLALVLLSSTIIFAQNIKKAGIIIDSKTNLPLPFVSIYFEENINTNNTGSISNENGEFSFDIQNVKKIIFSHLNYEQLSVHSSTNFSTIKLVPKTFELDEIIVSNESPQDYLKKIINNSEGRIEKNMLLKSFCRETVQINNEITKFSDALIDYYVRKGNGKSNVIMQQHRAFGKSKNTEEEDSKLEAINSAFDVKNHVTDSYDFQVIKNLLKSDDYEFERKIKKDNNGVEYEYVAITPNANSNELLNTGHIIIDPKTKSIIEFKIYTSQNHLKNAKSVNILIAKVRLNKTMNWSKFKTIDNNYVLMFNKKEIDLYIKMGNKVDHSFAFKNDLFVYEFKNDTEIPDSNYSKKTIFQAGTKYSSNYWNDYNVFPINEVEKNFISANQVK